MYRGFTVAVALVGGVLAGCGSAGTNTTTTVTITTERGAAQAPQAPTAEPRKDAAGALLKEVGEGAGVACASPDAPCDIEFTVTAIEPNYACADKYNIAPLSPGQSYFRFSIDGKAADKFDWQGSSDALRINYWAIEDADGVLHRDLKIASPCTDNADAFVQSFVPGTRMKGTVTVLGPASAKELRLISGGTSWVWPVPQNP